MKMEMDTYQLESQKEGNMTHVVQAPGGANKPLKPGLLFHP